MPRESDSLPRDDRLVRMRRAIHVWADRAEPKLLVAWLDREIGAGGLPQRLPIREWWPCLEALAEARSSRPDAWPEALDAGCQTLFTAALRSTRPNGSGVFEADRARPDRGELAHRWASWLGEPSWKTVVDRWWPAKKPAARGEAARRSRANQLVAAPPLPAQAIDRGPLAFLRPDWNRDGDWVAVDHRDHRIGTSIQLIGAGHDLLGPTWGGPTGPGRVTHWATGPFADVFEWSFRREGSKITRTAVLLRGRHMALLAEQSDGAAPSSESPLALPIAPGLEMALDPESQVARLKDGRTVRALLMPLSATEPGLLSFAENHVHWGSMRSQRRSWAALLIDWDRDRDRRGAFWRRLTITERSRVCGPDEAVAFRVGWGRAESLVIYRSLVEPALRAVLGHQTTAWLLVGTFSREGDMKPLVTVE